jgi:hypothetical protein
MKETFYFSHDYEPTSDPKIQALINQFGWMGYGLFWRIIEMLHSDQDHKLPKKKYLYLSLVNNSTGVQHTSTPVEQVSTFVEQCITDFELFVTDGDFFWSNRVLSNIEKRQEVSENRSKAGKRSAELRKGKKKSTLVQQVSTGVQQNPTKERKGKESILLMEKVSNFEFNGFIDQKEGVFRLAKLLDEKFPKVSSMKIPFSAEEICKVVKKYNSDEIMETLMAMENYTLLHQKSDSAYLTIINWLKRRERV